MSQWPRWIWAAMIAVPLLAVVNGRGEFSGWRQTTGPVSEDNMLNFPPPDPVGEIQSDGQAHVTAINAVPGVMRIRLRREGKEYSYSTEPCLSCSHTNDVSLLRKFCDHAPQTSFYLPPGTYEAFVSFHSRVKNFRSDWTLASSWAYEMCVGGKITW